MSERVSGEIVLPDGVVMPDRATVRVRVEDVSRADGEAEVVGENVQEDVELPGPGGRLRFAVPLANDHDPAGDYALRVHIDVTGSGEVDLGDFVTTQRYPVFGRAAPGDMEVAVKKVGP